MFLLFKKVLTTQLSLSIYLVHLFQGIFDLVLCLFYGVPVGMVQRSDFVQSREQQWILCYPLDRNLKSGQKTLLSFNTFAKPPAERQSNNVTKCTNCSNIWLGSA